MINKNIYITAPKNIIEYGVYNLGMKYLAANTIMIHIKNVIVAGNGNIFYGIGCYTAHVLVYLQARSHDVLFNLYDGRHVRHMIPLQLSHPVGHNTHVSLTESYCNDI